jgi:transcriptional antiterminator RfaH
MTTESITNWYVANTHVNGETVAAGHLQRQDFSVYLPLYKKLHSHARRKEWVSRPLFPRYLFVGVNEANQHWQAIKSTIGINQLVSFGGEPAPIGNSIIESLRAREDETGMVALASASTFQKGDPVKFLDGALSNQIGLFDSIDDKMRVTVLLDLLGRKLRVCAPIDTVQACS